MYMSPLRPTRMTMSQARNAFAKVLTRAEHGQPVQITRGGRPVAVVVSVEQYREVKAGASSASRALHGFLSRLDRGALKGADPWRGVRDRSAGRPFRW